MCPAAVVDDVAALRSSPLTNPSTSLFGFVYHTDTGDLESITKDPGATDETPQEPIVN
jgi:carbonic anhydrase